MKITGKYLKDESGNKFSPVTSINTVYTSTGANLKTILTNTRPILLGSYGGYANSYKLNSSFITLCTHFIIDYQLYGDNGNTITLKYGSQFLHTPDNSGDNFSIWYSWWVGGNMWTSADEFDLDISTSKITRHTSTRPTESFGIGISKVWGLVDTELML